MVDLLGYAASIAVLATFLMPTMLPLRFVAILSNILFLLYGYFAHIPPVLFLHATLLPINVLRLLALWKLAHPQQNSAARRFASTIGNRCGFF
jgi:CRP/FNR family cyclic AMP-dependent transcriptional regulator